MGIACCTFGRVQRRRFWFNHVQFNIYKQAHLDISIPFIRPTLDTPTVYSTYIGYILLLVLPTLDTSYCLFYLPWFDDFGPYFIINVEVNVSVERTSGVRRKEPLLLDGVRPVRGAWNLGKSNEYSLVKRDWFWPFWRSQIKVEVSCCALTENTHRRGKLSMVSR